MTSIVLTKSAKLMRRPSRAIAQGAPGEHARLVRAIAGDGP
jgi:hypothetical protein